MGRTFCLHILPWIWRQYISPKRWWPPTRLFTIVKTTSSATTRKFPSRWRQSRNKNTRADWRNGGAEIAYQHSYATVRVVPTAFTYSSFALCRIPIIELMYIKHSHLGTDRLSSRRLRPKFHLPPFIANPATPTSNLFLEIMGYTLGYGLEGPELEFQTPNVQIAYGSRPTSSLMGIGGKAAGAWSLQLVSI